MLPFIPDGYESRGYIAAVENLFPAIRFKFRPMTQEEYGQVVDWANGLKQGEYFRKVTPVLARKIIDWDCRNEHGNTWPATVENLLKLRPALLQRLSFIVAGLSGSDTDPEWSPEEAAENSDLERSATVNGSSVIVEREARDLKNSLAE